jgi:hypothetical protein
MAKVRKEDLRAAHELAATLRAKAKRELKRAHDVLDKSRNTVQVSVFRRALLKLEAKKKKSGTPPARR